MRTLIAAVLASVSLAVPALGNSALENNALYQWDTKNGTPTYSPDPPPEGVKYIVVGADLQPLARQPVLLSSNESKVTKSTVAAATSANTKITPTPVAPAKKWKPVRYANAPATDAQTIVKANRAIEPIGSAEIAQPIAYESDDCLTLKREKLILESQFARAKTNADMDQAILSLHEKSSEYRQRCQRN